MATSVGDTVVIKVREYTAADTKSGLYFPHFGGLRGEVLKVYGEEASVSVDRDSLPGDLLLRHEASEAQERQKWLDRLSEEAKRSLSEDEKRFSFRYAVLVSVSDLEPVKGAPPKKATAEDLDKKEEAFLATRRKK